MDLLFQRRQTQNILKRTYFRLHAKLELTEEEDRLIRKYDFADTTLVHSVQPTLLRNAFMLGFVCFIFAVPIIAMNWFREIGFGWPGVLLVAALVGLGAGYVYYGEKRETIYVRDLLHGRYFKCRSVCELARKEAYLETITSYLRQVMESAKHWGGAEKRDIPVLSKEEAKAAILSGPLF